MSAIDYTYDNLSRLIEADYIGNRNYQYVYDVAGNRTYQETTIGITTTTTNWAFNSANQMTTMQIGANPAVNFSYDDNGNLLDDGMLTYTWDRANRLKTLYNGSYNTHFAYDGNGDRHQQNIGGTITNYLLDLQPELALVLGETVSANTTHYVHSPMGVHSAYDGSDWVELLQDGLGSVRAQVDAMGQISADQLYDPYGQVIDDNGTWIGSFGYAGEQTDESGLGYNRARYYNPAMGAFASLDPFEGYEKRPMSINGYGYVEGNPANWTDPSGMLTIKEVRDLEKDICTLCDELYDRDSEDVKDLDKYCWNSLMDICDALCGGYALEAGSDCISLTDHPDKGLFQRWDEYKVNPKKLGQNDRNTHANVYNNIQECLDEFLKPWNGDNSRCKSDNPKVQRVLVTARQWAQQPLEFSIPLINAPEIIPEPVPAYDTPQGIPTDNPDLIGVAQEQFDKPLICLECVANVVKKLVEIVILGIVITVVVFVVIGLGIELGVFAAIGSAISAIINAGMALAPALALAPAVASSPTLVGAY